MSLSTVGLSLSILCSPEKSDRSTCIEDQSTDQPVFDSMDCNTGIEEMATLSQEGAYYVYALRFVLAVLIALLSLKHGVALGSDRTTKELDTSTWSSSG